MPDPAQALDKMALKMQWLKKLLADNGGGASGPETLRDLAGKVDSATQKTEFFREKGNALNNLIQQTLPPIRSFQRSTERSLEDMFGKSSWWTELKRRIANL